MTQFNFEALVASLEIQGRGFAPRQKEELPVTPAIKAEMALNEIKKEVAEFKATSNEAWKVARATFTAPVQGHRGEVKNLTPNTPKGGDKSRDGLVLSELKLAQIRANKKAAKARKEAFQAASAAGYQIRAGIEEILATQESLNRELDSLVEEIETSNMGGEEYREKISRCNEIIQELKRLDEQEDLAKMAKKEVVALRTNVSRKVTIADIMRSKRN